MIDFTIDTKLFDSAEMKFSIRLDDPKAVNLKPDVPLEHDGERYYITEAVTVRENGVDLKKVTAEIGWMKLADIKKPGDFVLTNVSGSDGLAAILADTGWQTGGAMGEGLFSLTMTDPSVLSLIWEWAKVCNLEPDFFSMNKAVALTTTPGVTLHTFTYGVDTIGVEKIESPPLYTRLTMVGKDDLSLVSVAGHSYIEDYSWYTSQGMSLAEAQLHYRKDEIINDPSIIDAAVLYTTAHANLKIASQGLITYRARVADLSSLTGVQIPRLRAGYQCRVQDQILGQYLDVRISRMLEHPNEPELNEVELIFGNVALPTSQAQPARTTSGRDWDLITNRNETTARSIRNFSSIIHRTKLRHQESTEWVMGYTLKGTGVGTSIVTVEFTDDETGLPIWDSLVVSLVNGQAFNYAWTFGQKEIPAGVTTVVVRAYSNTASAGLDVAVNMSSWWVLARGVTREVVSLPNSIRFDYTGAHQYWTVPDDVFEVLIEAHGSRGGGSQGGQGGSVTGRAPVTPGQDFLIAVGGHGPDSGGTPQSSYAYPNGGMGGSAGSASSEGRNGGGATYIVNNSSPFTSALLVAAGGGGHPREGGLGGFYVGTDGTDATSGGTKGFGATQIAGGAAGSGTSQAGDTDGQGYGGKGGDGTGLLGPGGGGGGGGWHGGGGGGNGGTVGFGASGGGGAGYVSGVVSDVEYTDGNHDDEGYMIISWENPEESGGAGTGGTGPEGGGSGSPGGEPIEPYEPPTHPVGDPFVDMITEPTALNTGPLTLPTTSTELGTLSGGVRVLIITTPGAVYDRVRFECNPSVRAPNVVFNNCSFKGDGTVGPNGSQRAMVVNTHAQAVGTTFNFCEFSPTIISKYWSAAVSGHKYAAYRCYLEHLEDGFSFHSTVFPSTDNNIESCFATKFAFWRPDVLGRAEGSHIDFAQHHNGPGHKGNRVANCSTSGGIDPTIGDWPSNPGDLDPDLWITSFCMFSPQGGATEISGVYEHNWIRDVQIGFNFGWAPTVHAVKIRTNQFYNSTFRYSHAGIVKPASFHLTGDSEMTGNLEQPGNVPFNSGAWSGTWP